jgi:hypothetical protein
MSDLFDMKLRLSLTNFPISTKKEFPILMQVQSLQILDTLKMSLGLLGPNNMNSLLDGTIRFAAASNYLSTCGVIETRQSVSPEVILGTHFPPDWNGIWLRSSALVSLGMQIHEFPEFKHFHPSIRKLLVDEVLKLQSQDFRYAALSSNLQCDCRFHADFCLPCHHMLAHRNQLDGKFWAKYITLFDGKGYEAFETRIRHGDGFYSPTLENPIIDVKNNLQKALQMELDNLSHFSQNNPEQLDPTIISCY